MPNEPRIRPTRVESYPDGSAVRIEFEELPLPANDPYVRIREGARREGVLSEVITEFAASPARPPSYPIDMPFLANRPAWTTESPNDSHSPGARWRCNDPDAVIAELIAISRADGWLRGAAPRALAAALSPDAVVLQRPGRVRVLTKYEAGDVRIVELVEFADDWFES